MNNTSLKTLLAATCAAVAFVGSANAGGFSRGTADTSILYEPGNFTMRTSATYVSPNREITAAPDSAGLVGTSYTHDYVMPSAAMKMGISDRFFCAGTISQPYGGFADYAAPNRLDNPTPVAGGIFQNYGKKFEEFTVNEAGLTCAIKMQVGPGSVYLLGGGFVEQFDYNRDNWLSPDGATVANLKLAGTDMGYRIGAAYDVPEIALRGEVLYRSGTSYGARGELTLGTLVLPSSGTGELPQSVEVNLRTGVVEGWAVLASVKWMDWSVTEQLIVATDNGLVRDANDYFWDDGWTVTGGVAHAFNKSVLGLVALSWDKGVGTGYDLSSDTWTLASGLTIKDKIGGELVLGGSVAYLTGASETLDIDANGNVIERAGLSVKDDWAYAGRIGYTIRW